jgi:hypothetical protein
MFGNTRWFKYDRDKLWLVYTQIVPVIFEPPCIIENRHKCRVAVRNGYALDTYRRANLWLRAVLETLLLTMNKFTVSYGVGKFTTMSIRYCSESFSPNTCFSSFLSIRHHVAYSYKTTDKSEFVCLGRHLKINGKRYVVAVRSMKACGD